MVVWKCDILTPPPITIKHIEPKHLVARRLAVDATLQFASQTGAKSLTDIFDHNVALATNITRQSISGWKRQVKGSFGEELCSRTGLICMLGGVMG